MTTGFYFKFNAGDANRLLLTLILFEIFLVVMYFLGVFLKMPSAINILFNLDREATIPAWFSSAQLLLIGILFIFSNNWAQINRIVNPEFLLIVGMSFVYLSMDESAVIHEKITGTLNHIKWIPRFKGNHGIWIPIYSIIFVLLATIGRHTIFSILKIYPRQSLLVFSGLLIFVLGGVGLEIIYYLYLEDSGRPILTKVEIAFEELFEMLGASIVLYGTILCAIRDTKSASSG